MMRSWLAGERNGQEIAVFLVAGMVGVALLTLLAHTGSGSGTMVSVSHVQSGNTCENLGDTVVDLLVADHPEMVAEAFGSSREIVVSLVVLHVVGNDLVDLVVVGIREEYRLEVGLLKLDVLHAVLLFSMRVSSCFLILPDQ